VRRIGPRWERERERGPHLHSVDDRGGSGELDRHLAQTATSCTWRRVALDVGEGGSGSCSLGSRLPTRTDGSVAAHAELGLRRHDAWSSDAELGSSELGMVRKDMATVKLRKSPAAGSCTRRDEERGSRKWVAAVSSAQADLSVQLGRGHGSGVWTREKKMGQSAQMGLHGKENDAEVAAAQHSDTEASHHRGAARTGRG
jgi:hypothetical protein